MRWKPLHKVAFSIKQAIRPLKALKLKIKRILGLLGPVTVQPYFGYGTREAALLRARVLEEKALTKPTDSSSLWVNLRDMLKRYDSDEIAGATVEVTGPAGTETLRSDADGFIEARLGPSMLSDSDSSGWGQVTLRLLKPLGRRQSPVEKTAYVQIPTPKSAIGVISDVDDTIVETGAQHLLKHIRTVLLTNAHTRTPFPGVSHLLRAIQGGDNLRRPIFYVSSSPWNIYDLFVEYMRHNEIPRGPLFLKDFGLDKDKWFKGSHDAHKKRAIEEIFETYPQMRFILIGDSGQRDADIYHDIVTRYPKRVASVWIRDVSGSGRQGEREDLFNDIRAQGVPVGFGPHLLEGAEIARENKWISESEFEEIRCHIQDRREHEQNQENNQVQGSKEKEL